ncbi:MAG: hypothetical protein ACPGD8_00895 [Flavobacteriales bacterium]
MAGKKTVNPFDKGVSYKVFLAALPKGKTISEYLKDVCTSEQLEWLEIELEHFKKK